MRSLKSLRDWSRELLPHHTNCAQTAAVDLLRALLVRFTPNLTQLARQADRETPARGARQFFARWLRRPQWKVEYIYAALPQLVPAIWRGQKRVPLLLDCTHLGGGGTGWTVFQVSLPWQRRALPVYRVVTSRSQPEWGQTEVLLAACGWLAQVLPGPRSRYVLVMDRGFPSHRLIQELQALGWRFVLRVNDDWKLTHPQFTGRLRDLRAREARLYRDAVLGRWERGKPLPRCSCRVQLVAFRGEGYQDTWYLATTEACAATAVAIYRQRMQIEAEFRDLKGPWGLDTLMEWCDREAVARFLAWVAVYEWRLAFLWCAHQLHAQRPDYQAYGGLSWFRTTQEWIARQLRLPKTLSLACL